MALSYVGGNSNTGSGATISVDLTALTGGSGSTALEDDIVVVYWGWGANADITPTLTVNTSGYSYAYATQRGNDTRDAVGRMAYKVMGSTPDTACVVDGSSNAAYGAFAAVQVWRGVDTASPLTGTASGTSGINGNHGNPPAITPDVNDAVVICGMSGAVAPTTSDTKTGPTNYTTYEVKTRGDGTGSDCYGSINARILSGGSGVSEDPGAYSGGDSSTVNAWTAGTLALRPAVTSSGDGTASGSSSVSGVGRYLQIARPEADISNTGWKNEAAGASPLYSSVNEESDSTFIYSETLGDICKLRFADLVDPTSDQWHAMPLRVRRPNGYGSLTARVKQDTTTIATRTFSNIGANWENVAFNLSGAEADALTDYGNVVVELENV